jgi:phytoene synthase
MQNFPLEEKIRLGYRKAKNITKENAKTFYFASCLLPREKKFACYSVYAVCRLSDDSVDIKIEQSEPARLEEIRKKIDAAYQNKDLEDALILVFAQTVNRFKIPQEYFQELLSGMEMDLQKTRYENFGQTYEYCSRVAGVIGLILLKIFQTENREAAKYAQDLGIAFQLTNILRDIKEDLARQRIYLPLDEMADYQISEENLRKEIVDDHFIDFLKFQIIRARRYYDSALKGVKLVEGLRQRLVILAMRNIYCAILDEIEKNHYDVFSQRAQVGFGKKLLIFLKIIFGGKQR